MGHNKDFNFPSGWPIRPILEGGSHGQGVMNYGATADSMDDGVVAHIGSKTFKGRDRVFLEGLPSNTNTINGVSGLASHTPYMQGYNGRHYASEDSPQIVYRITRDEFGRLLNGEGSLTFSVGKELTNDMFAIDRVVGESDIAYFLDDANGVMITGVPYPYVDVMRYAWQNGTLSTIGYHKEEGVRDETGQFLIGLRARKNLHHKWAQNVVYHYTYEVSTYWTRD